MFHVHFLWHIINAVTLRGLNACSQHGYLFISPVTSLCVLWVSTRAWALDSAAQSVVTWKLCGHLSPEAKLDSEVVSWRWCWATFSNSMRSHCISHSLWLSASSAGADCHCLCLFIKVSIYSFFSSSFTLSFSPDKKSAFHMVHTTAIEVIHFPQSWGLYLMWRLSAVDVLRVFQDGTLQWNILTQSSLQQLI